jgi:hypothetical protein
LSLRGALAALDPPDDPDEPDEQPEPKPARRPTWENLDSDKLRQHYELWWELFAVDVVMLDASGAGPEEIAETLHMPVEQVSAILSPQAPVRFDNWENGWELCDPDTVDEIMATSKWYAASVAWMIHHTMADVYRRAVARCQEIGLAHLAPVLADRQAQSQRQKAACADRGCYTRDLSVYLDSAWPHCIELDVRYALAIQTDGSDGWNEWLGPMYEGVERGQEAARIVSAQPGADKLSFAEQCEQVRAILDN